MAHHNFGSATFLPQLLYDIIAVLCYPALHGADIAIYQVDSALRALKATIATLCGGGIGNGVEKGAVTTTESKSGVATTRNAVMTVDDAGGAPARPSHRMRVIQIITDTAAGHA